MRRRLYYYCSLWIITVLFIVFLQWRSEAYKRDFEGASGDEASHFVTSIMVRDYLVKGLGAGTSPLAFAERFYISYPRVTFGIWPPLFHLVGGTWFAAASLSRWSALLLMAMLLACLGCLQGWEAKRHFGLRWALGASAIFAAMPLIGATASFYGADPAVSLFMFAAALAWTRYLVCARARWSVAFGLLAAIALLIKYNGLALALLPVISIPLTRRWDLLKRRATWLPAALVAIIAGPWYYFSWHLVKYAAEGGEPPDRWGSFLGNLEAIGSTIGIATLVTAALGVARAIADRRNAGHTAATVWHLSLVSFIASVLLFHSFVYPYVQDRYLLSCVPAAILLSVSGFRRLLAHPSSDGHLPAALALASLLLFLVSPLLRASTPSSTLGEAGKYLSSNSGPRGRRILISANFLAEGAVISEIAMLEERPFSYLLRASKMLAQSSWNGKNYRLLYRTEADVLKVLDEMRVGSVLVDDAAAEPHNVLVRRALPGAPDTWTLVKSFRSDRPSTLGQGPREFRLYRRIAPFVHPERQLAVDLSYTLGRSLSFSQAAW